MWHFFKALYYLDNIWTFKNWEETRGGLNVVASRWSSAKGPWKQSGCPSSGLVAMRTVSHQGHAENTILPVSLFCLFIFRQRVSQYSSGWAVSIFFTY